MKGFSVRNLKYMRAFAEAWPQEPFVQQVVAQTPWGHQVRLLDQVPDRRAREFYLRQAILHGQGPDLAQLGLTGSVLLVALALAYAYFKRCESRFADLI